jgi:hypothetical protein
MKSRTLPDRLVYGCVMQTVSQINIASSLQQRLSHLKIAEARSFCNSTKMQKCNSGCFYWPFNSNLDREKPTSYENGTY